MELKSGIYKIKNLINEDCYIGSSKDLKKREKAHFCLLRKNQSHSPILQRAVNKYGIENFQFEVLELCEIDSLFNLEQTYVDKLNPKYNSCKINVSVPTGLPYKDPSKYKTYAEERLKTCENFGWKSRKIGKLNDSGEVIKEYDSLKQYAEEHQCSIGNVGKALKKGNRCKGYYIIYL